MRLPLTLAHGRMNLVLFATLCAGILGSTVFAAEPTGIGEQVHPGWQTFESCPFGERPCGPVCMPQSFSCCYKPTASICPPGKSCCGTGCGCGRCERCEEGHCVPDRQCREQDEEQVASQAGTSIELVAAVVPGAVLGIAILGAVLETGSDGRGKAPPPRPPVSP